MTSSHVCAPNQEEDAEGRRCEALQGLCTVSPLVFARPPSTTLADLTWGDAQSLVSGTSRASLRVGSGDVRGGWGSALEASCTCLQEDSHREFLSVADGGGRGHGVGAPSDGAAEGAAVRGRR
jgi:hypothetical protein